MTRVMHGKTHGDHRQYKSTPAQVVRPVELHSVGEIVSVEVSVDWRTDRNECSWKNELISRNNHGISFICLRRKPTYSVKFKLPLAIDFDKRWRLIISLDVRSKILKFSITWKLRKTSLFTHFWPADTSLCNACLMVGASFLKLPSSLSLVNDVYMLTLFVTPDGFTR